MYGQIALPKFCLTQEVQKNVWKNRHGVKNIYLSDIRKYVVKYVFLVYFAL
jgi:hypothetical protein